MTYASQTTSSSSSLHCHTHGVMTSDPPLDNVRKLYGNYSTIVYHIQRAHLPFSPPSHWIDFERCHSLNMFTLVALFSGVSTVQKVEWIFTINPVARITLKNNPPNSDTAFVDVVGYLLPLAITSLRELKTAEAYCGQGGELIESSLQSSQTKLATLFKKVWIAALADRVVQQTNKPLLPILLPCFGMLINKINFERFKQELSKNQQNLSEEQRCVYYVAIKNCCGFLHVFVIEQFVAGYRIYQTTPEDPSRKERLCSNGFLHDTNKPYISEENFKPFLANLELILKSASWNEHTSQAFRKCFGFSLKAAPHPFYNYDRENNYFEGLTFQYLVDTFSPQDTEANLRDISHEISALSYFSRPFP